MKYKLMLMMLFVIGSVFAQTDSALNHKVDALTAKVNAIPPPAASATPKDDAECYLCKGEFSRSQKLLVLSPILLFLLLCGYCIIRLQREGYRLSDALTEPEPSMVANPAYTVGSDLPEKIPGTDRPRSSSRLIAFFSGMVAISIALCSSSYYFYMYLKTGHEPSLDNLYSILLTFGIGVTPYAVNKLTDSMKKP